MLIIIMGALIIVLMAVIFEVEYTAFDMAAGAAAILMAVDLAVNMQIISMDRRTYHRYLHKFDTIIVLLPLMMGSTVGVIAFHALAVMKVEDGIMYGVPCMIMTLFTHVSSEVLRTARV
ncbi:MAG: hypothetical protein D6746_01510 [Bacteroidetes bacterium]|nr:MAG: hypothetical protein D6746_01510 [Bacteroidota bacterium]